MATVNGVSSAQSTTSTRWIQLVLGLIAMMSISSPQYGWAFFTKPLQDSLGVQLSALQVTFTILIVLQTFLSPLQGYLIDRFGAQAIGIRCTMHRFQRNVRRTIRSSRSL